MDQVLEEWVRIETTPSQAVLVVWTGRRWEPVLARPRAEALDDAAAPVRAMVRVLIDLVDSLALRVVAQAELLTSRAERQGAADTASVAALSAEPGSEFGRWLAEMVWFDFRGIHIATAAARIITQDEAGQMAYRLLLLGKGVHDDGPHAANGEQS